MRGERLWWVENDIFDLPVRADSVERSELAEREVIHEEGQ